MCHLFVLNGTTKVYMLVLIALVEVFYVPLAIVQNDLKRMGYLQWTITTMHFPINILASQERVAMYVVIVLGECLVVILHALPGDKIFDAYIVNFFGLLLIFAIAMQYFEKVMLTHTYNCIIVVLIYSTYYRIIRVTLNGIEHCNGG